jgi:hypothetical protein
MLTIEKLRAHKNPHDIQVHSLQSLTDSALIDSYNQSSELKALIKLTPCLAARIDNIMDRDKTDNINTSSKEIQSVLRSGASHGIVEFLCALDDKSFVYASKSPAIASVIDDSPQLFIRMESIVNEDRVRSYH